jgi:hypothetical protein
MRWAHWGRFECDEMGLSQLPISMGRLLTIVNVEIHWTLLFFDAVFLQCGDECIAPGCSLVLDCT